ncbi:MAG TPA: NADH-quinone oxidoreductase subunit M [Verrucomicrobiae bacterium]|jgi:NADH-quinone oxidoreductase subunit M
MSPLTLIFILPLVAALVILLIPGNFRFLIRCVALAGTFLSMLVAIYMFCHFDKAAAAGYQFVEQHQWAPSLGLSYHVGVDGINLGLILMGAVVVFAATAVSWSIKTREKEFYILLLTMGGGILGAFASLDMFFFYFFHELALVPTFIMIGIWGRGEQKNYATFQITLYLSVGALLVLLGLIGIYMQLPAGQRTFDFVGLTDYFRAHPMELAAQRWIFPMLLFGFGVLVSLWPFHTWAPLGYGSAPSGTAMIHSGVLKKFGLYGLIRIALPMMPESAHRWMHVLALLCLGNILYCGLVAMRQRNLNMLIGNSSVAHMGFAFLGIASLGIIGITGTVLIMVAHGFLAALTFALSGYLRDEIKTTEIPEMGGLLQHLPFIGTVMIMAMLAGCGVPGFANFPGEALVLFGYWDRSPFITGLAVWGALIIAGVYMLRAIRNIWHGEKQWSELQDAPTLWRQAPYGLLLAGLLVFGCFPRLLTDNIKKSVATIVQTQVANAKETTALVSANSR